MPESQPNGSYASHVAERVATTARALAETGLDRLLIHSGTPFTYFADDNDAPFHTTPHFAHWAPVAGPGHVLDFTPGKRPRLVRLTPLDFWYAAPAPPPDFVLREFDVVDVVTPEALWKEVPPPSPRTAFIGGDEAPAHANGVGKAAINPKSLTERLDWERSYKSTYEVAALAEATAKAARGFRAAEGAFRAGAPEIEIHHAYVSAVGDVDTALPYPTIVGLDDKAGTLHYHGKRGRGATPGTVLLIDAGASSRMYGSDITRTFVTPKADPVFVRLLDGMRGIQRRLAEEARPGRPYLDMHLLAHRLIGGLLADTRVLKVSGDVAFAKGLTRPFLPHGLGHFLGIQVHDVAGRQGDRTGTHVPPPAEHPYLRTTRTIEERQVFTIEPGLYFIPMLLAPYREGTDRAAFDWPLVDRLVASGGIRIEDNLYVGKDRNRNLTREALPE
jgi:Xaa-Pro dipeptidase